MDRDFSHIVGELSEGQPTPSRAQLSLLDLPRCEGGHSQTGEPATIRFYGKITEESATRFNSEFDRLESGRPSLIRVLINCEGGSVLHGMSSYATIQNSCVPTECVNEGMAASMGSVLWAAGTRSLMRDYAIMMIHNPFMPTGDGEGGEMVLAFTKQIKTIYRKRFGLSEEHVEAIMRGEAGRDGTFFDAEAAVKAGIIPSYNILATTPQLRDRVRVELSALESAADIRSMMGRVSAEAESLDTTFKPSAPSIPTLNQTSKTTIMNPETKTTAEYSAVAATLGMKEDFEPKDVMARLSELLSTETKFKSKERELSDAQTVIAGRDATIRNLQKELGEATASLSTYLTKEQEDKAARIESMIEAAITAGKIDRPSKADWVAMAEANLSLAENTLASIPAREQISKQIAADPAGVKSAADAAKSVTEQVADKVAAVVGETFEFKKID